MGYTHRQTEGHLPAKIAKPAKISMCNDEYVDSSGSVTIWIYIDIYGFI